MKNQKVFVEVKKICTNFLYKKTLFATCQLSVYKRTRNRVLRCFLNILVFLSCDGQSRAGAALHVLLYVQLYAGLQVWIRIHIISISRRQGCGSEGKNRSKNKEKVRGNCQISNNCKLIQIISKLARTPLFLSCFIFYPQQGPQ